MGSKVRSAEKLVSMMNADNKIGCKIIVTFFTLLRESSTKKKTSNS